MEHYSVMLEEAIELLNVKGDGIYVDGTLGRGGHSSAILKQLTTGHLYCFDLDQQALDESEERLREIGSSFTLLKANYADMQEVLGEDRGITKRVWRHSPMKPDDSLHSMIFGWFACRVLSGRMDFALL